MLLPHVPGLVRARMYTSASVRSASTSFLPLCCRYGYRIPPAMVLPLETRTYLVPPEVFKIAQINVHQGNTIPLSKTLSAVELVMDMNQRQIALSVLESLRGDLVYAHLNNGSRVLDVADLRQYIYALTGSPLEVHPY